MRNDKEQLEIGIAYLHGRIEAQLEAFAATLGVPAIELTSRVGSLLLLGSQERITNSVRDVRSKATKAHKSIRKVEMGSSTHTSSSRSRPRQSSSIKQYWANMTPEQRSEEMKRRYKKRAA